MRYSACERYIDEPIPYHEPIDLSPKVSLSKYKLLSTIVHNGYENDAKVLQ